MKCVLRASEQLQRANHMLALGELCSGAWGQLQRWFQVLVLGKICFEGMGAVAKAVSFVANG